MSTIETFPDRCPRCVRENRPSIYGGPEYPPDVPSTPEEIAAAEAEAAWWDDPNNQVRRELEHEEALRENARRDELAPKAKRFNAPIITCGCGTLGVKGLRHPPNDDIEDGYVHTIDEKHGYCQHDKPEQDCAECRWYWCEACGNDFRPGEP